MLKYINHATKSPHLHVRIMPYQLVNIHQYFPSNQPRRICESTRVVPKVMSNNCLQSNMLYYWQTKYTALIYRLFFIFSHNRHFFIHISLSVLGVWKFPFCKIPFQPSEDTDALLPELPSLSHNVVRAADPSQTRKDGRRRVPDQGYRRGVEELPTPSLQLLPMWGERHILKKHTISYWKLQLLFNSLLPL